MEQYFPFQWFDAKLCPQCIRKPFKSFRNIEYCSAISRFQCQLSVNEYHFHELLSDKLYNYKTRKCSNLPLSPSPLEWNGFFGNIPHELHLYNILEAPFCFQEVLGITLLWVEAPFVFQKCWVSHFYELKHPPFVFQNCWVSHFYGQFFVSLPLKCRTAVSKIETSLSEDDERSRIWLKRYLIWPRVSFFGSNFASPKKWDKSELWDQTAVENASDLCFRFRGKVNQIFGADKAC